MVMIHWAVPKWITDEDAPMVIIWWAASKWIIDETASTNDLQYLFASKLTIDEADLTVPT